METASEVDRDLALDVLMRQWPGAVGVFIRHGVHCVGCNLSPFHSLKDAAQFHGVSEGRLAREIAESGTTPEP